MDISKFFRLYGIYCIFLLLGVGIGITAHLLFQNNTQKNRSIDSESRLKGYKFISPLLECGTAQPSSLTNILHMKNRVKNVIDIQKRKHDVDHIAVYFRDMNNGPWFGIDESMKFAPASMLKVPVLISYLKKAETNPTLLKQSYMVKDLSKTGTNFESPKTVRIGTEYTVDQLLEYMIAYSDNSAKDVLVQNIDNVEYATMLNNLGVDINPEVGEIDIMSVREYSSFFRILYNASYLGSDMSEKALTMLNKTTFNIGIVAGVPKSIPVAHKFGERRYTDIYKNEFMQLHDCGIVYYPGKPYLLCVMSRGTDFTKLGETIKKISFAIYQGMEEFSR